MKTLIKLELLDGRACYLQTEYKDDGRTGFKLILVVGMDVYKGQVSEDDLDNLRLNIKMDFNTFTKQTLQALTKSGGTDIVFNYQLKQRKDDKVELVWKKYVPSEDITFQLGKAVFNTSTMTGNILSSILNPCIECIESLQSEIKTLQTDHDRLSLERINALKRLEKCVVAKEELETDLYSKFAAVVNSKKEKIRELKHSTGSPVVKTVTESKPGPSGTSTQQKTQKRPAKDDSNSDEDHTTDDEGATQQSKRPRKGGNKSLDDDSLVLEDENEDKPKIAARPKRNREANKKTTNSKPVLPKVSSRDLNSSVTEKPTPSRKSRMSSGNTQDNDPNAMIDDL